VQTSNTLERPLPTSIQSQSRNSFGAILGGAILVLLGGLWMLDVAGAIELKWAIVWPALLTVIGVALIIGAWNGAHSGPVVAGLFLSIAVVAMAAFPLSSFDGGLGNRQYRVTQQTSLASSYEVGVGDLTLDLSDLRMVESATVQVSAGAGNLTVILPSSIPVDINGTVGAGEVDILGETGDGLSVTRHYQSEGFETANITLTLDMSVGAGQIEVTR
jgi:Cell wall-active antibiotics response 4TMS YvqF